MAEIASFQCSRCNSAFEPFHFPTICEKCAGALYVRYDLTSMKGLQTRDAIATSHGTGKWNGMWRYRDVLPSVDPVTLGEGWTPMLPSRRYPNVFLKEEGANPTGTFKARGLAMAISMLRAYGRPTSEPIAAFGRRRGRADLSGAGRPNRRHGHEANDLDPCGWVSELGYDRPPLIGGVVRRQIQVGRPACGSCSRLNIDL